MHAFASLLAMDTKRAAATLILAMATLLLITGGVGACDNVPSMDMDAACLKACTSQRLYQLCRATLRHADPAGEVTGYALVAARFAKLSYESAMETADRLRQDASRPGDERAAYARCRDRYEHARGLISVVVDQLFACSFAGARQEYVDAAADVRACGNGLAKFRLSPLYAMNAADQDRTMLAYDLGALIVGK